MEPRSANRLRRRLYEVLDVGSSHDQASLLTHRALVVLVLISVGAVILESVPSLEARFRIVFLAIEIVAAVIFSIEYVLRIWAAVEHPPLAHLPHWRARLAYALQPTLLIDLVAVIPFFLSLVGPSDWQVLLLLRLLRFFKLTRYSPGVRSLFEAVRDERRALLACLIILGGLMIVAAAAMHVAERTAQPDKFGSIPDAMYWAIITLTTVGYGDVTPVTTAGRLIAGITAITGLVMLSLPVGIIATSFAEVIHRRDFVVTWSMVARVPVFQGLEALDIANIIRYLRSRVVEPGEVIVRRDEPGDSMFFIASGSVEVELPERRIRLDDGHFFGEIAMLQRGRRTATVRALETARLLVLSHEDFQALVDQNPTIGARIRETASRRGVATPVEQGGDLAVREIRPDP